MIALASQTYGRVRMGKYNVKPCGLIRGEFIGMKVFLSLSNIVAQPMQNLCYFGKELSKECVT